MPDPTQLASVAQQLLREAASSTVLTTMHVDAHLRRAVSTAYYAMFHKAVRAAAACFVGSDQTSSAAYNLFYRAFEHRQMKEICRALQTPILRGRYRDHLRRSAISQDLCNFASAFATLQEARHLADYDPTAIFFFYDASALVDSAIEAMKAFDRVPAEEQRDVLALMLVGARGQLSAQGLPVAPSLPRA